MKSNTNRKPRLYELPDAELKKETDKLIDAISKTLEHLGYKHFVLVLITVTDTPTGFHQETIANTSMEVAELAVQESGIALRRTIALQN